MPVVRRRSRSSPTQCPLFLDQNRGRLCQPRLLYPPCHLYPPHLLFPKYSGPRRPASHIGPEMIAQICKMDLLPFILSHPLFCFFLLHRLRQHPQQAVFSYKGLLKNSGFRRDTKSCCCYDASFDCCHYCSTAHTWFVHNNTCS